MTFATTTIASPVGALKLVASDVGLVAILWEDDRPNRVRLCAAVETPTHPILRRTETQLAEYFGGCRATFDVPLDVIGTPFQRLVWDALLRIPYGATKSYGAIAAEIGRPTASRAVGAANGRNPISIIVPCHRAIGSTGALTGFAGGLDTKRFLLELEARQNGPAARERPPNSAATRPCDLAPRGAARVGCDLASNAQPDVRPARPLPRRARS